NDPSKLRASGCGTRRRRSVVDLDFAEVLAGGADADYREEAAAAVALLAVAEELGDVAGGAEVGYVDVFFGDAGFEELELVGFGKVEVDVFGGRLVAWGHPVQPLQGIGFVAG